MLGQVRVADKSTEISAVPGLLGTLEIEDCIVTLDDLSCRMHTVEAIRCGPAIARH